MPKECVGSRDAGLHRRGATRSQRPRRRARRRGLARVQQARRRPQPLLGQPGGALPRVPVRARRGRRDPRAGAHDPVPLGRHARRPARGDRRRDAAGHGARGAPERRLGSGDRGAAAAPGPRPRRPDGRGDARDLRRARPRGADRAGTAHLEGALSARADRALRRLDARGRPAARPVAARPRPRRRRDPQARRALAADHGHGRRVGGLDGHDLPRQRPLRLPARPRLARDRPRGRPRRLLGAERLVRHPVAESWRYPLRP